MPIPEIRSRAARIATRAMETLPTKENHDLTTALLIRDCGTIAEQIEGSLIHNPAARKIYQHLLKAPEISVLQSQIDLQSLAGFARNYAMTNEYLKEKQIKPGVLAGEGTGKFVAYALSGALSIENAVLLTRTADAEVARVREKTPGNRVVVRLHSTPDALTPSENSNFEEIIRLIHKQYMELGTGTILTYRLPREAEFEGLLPNISDIERETERMGNISVQQYSNLPRRSKHMESVMAAVEDISRNMVVRKPSKYRLLSEYATPLRMASEVRRDIDGFNAVLFDMKRPSYKSNIQRLGIQRFFELTPPIAA